jgi:uncharacterized protein
MKNSFVNFLTSVPDCTFPLVAMMAVALTLSAQAAPKRVLVISTTAGFRHSSIETGNAVIEQLAKDSAAFSVDIVNVNPNSPAYRGADGKPDKAKVQEANQKALADKMSAEGLNQYDGIIFNNTTGDLPLPDKDAFLAWIKSGKAFVGMHAASDTFHTFAPYVDMIGGEFKTHGAQVEVDIINQDQQCPACRHLGKNWVVFDEIYQFKNFDRTKMHGLLTLDKHPNDKTPGDYPIAWIKEYGKGRVFYTALGHREDVWDPNWKDGKGERKNAPEIAKAYQQHILGGIKWALGLEKGDATPQTKRVE